MNSIQDLRQYLTSINTGDESAGLGDSGGYVNFSNSGRRGKKEFTLSLASILRGFEDIEKNIAAFAKGQNYVEATWRELGEKFEDGPLCAMIQVQTKPVFILFSKIIFWANNKNLSDFNTEKIEITSSSIQTTIKKLTQLISDFSPSATNPSAMAKIATSKNLNEIVKQLLASINKAGLTFSEKQIKRFIAAQNTKPFVILTGLSGSGKTKLAEAVAYWLSEDTKTQVCMVAVGADWTNNEPLLGYADAIDKTRYCAPSSGVLQLLTHAIDYKDKPHFLILDEMNLSHVERYFADFLSAMESSKPKLRLHGNDDVDLEASKMFKVPAVITLPPNVFIIGTVNVDETTYMFSPKVLDRANVIEFRVSTEQMTAFLAAPAASVSHPHETWTQEETQQPVVRGFKPSGKLMRQLASGSRRMAVPSGHSLYAVLPTLPERITVRQNSRTTDTPENRFVKFALRSFRQFLAEMRGKESSKRSNQPLHCLKTLKVSSATNKATRYKSF